MTPAFIVTGMGRSGTKWLATVLNKSSGARVYHEALGGWDSRHYWRIITGEMTPVQFVEKRGKQRGASGHYGDVNSYLRYAAGAFHDELDIPVAGLIRHGHWTVRSLMVRGCYQRTGYPPVPAPSQFETPFEKCCWYWSDTYERLDAWGIPIWRLEDLTTDYAKLCALTQTLGIVPPKEAMWKQLRGQRVNRTKGTDTSEPPVFDTNQRQVFAHIAGATQRRYGYVD